MSSKSSVKREVRSTFDFISHDYDKLRSRVWEDLTDFTKECLFPLTVNKSDLILDLACGNARHAIYFTQKYELRGIAIDFSSQLLKLAKKRLESSSAKHTIALINSDASNIPLRKNSLSAALYIAAIHHLPAGSERAKSLSEVRRVLFPGGRAIVTVWRKWQRRFASYFLKKHLRHVFGNKTDGELGDIHIPWKSNHGTASVLRFYHLFSKGELRKLITLSGFRIVKITKSSKKAGEASFFVCIEKKR
ncbi:MAG: methyltransferase domain-containing protein [Candidatus Atabeyarchaeum deiterrae]